MAQNPVIPLFPTFIYVKKLTQNRTHWFKNLKADCQEVFQKDKDGQAWSQKNYPGGFTTFGSLNQLHRLTGSFAMLARRLTAHLKIYLKYLGLEIQPHQLYLSRMWLNVNFKAGYHSWHHHPLSVISGVFYVEAPPLSGSLVLHDPRWPYFMNRPTDPQGNRYVIKPRPGLLVMFESYIPHHVEAHGASNPRISIAFNWDWKA